MKKFAALALVLSAIVLASAFIAPKLKQLGKSKLGKKVSNLSWSECDGTGSKYVDIDAIEVKGDFSVGSTASFEITGNVKQAFTHASTDLEVKFSIIKVYSGNVPVNPPVQYAVGPNTMKSSMTVTQDAPSGSYSMVVKINNDSKTKLQCVSIKYKLS